MAKKQPKNQLGLDYSVRGDRIIHLINDESNRIFSRQLFESMLHQDWESEPSGEIADISSAQEEIRLLSQRLLYPEQVKVARLFNQPAGFLGFSAILGQNGWVFVNAEADSYERRYFIFFLVATLGLYSTYSQEDSLRMRAEQLVFEVLMPEKDIRSFLPSAEDELTPVLAADMSDFFKVPFSKITERAFQLGFIRKEKLEEFPKLRPGLENTTREIYISHDPSIADELEKYLFGREDEDSE